MVEYSVAEDMEYSVAEDMEYSMADSVAVLVHGLRGRGHGVHPEEEKWEEEE